MAEQKAISVSTEEMNIRLSADKDLIRSQLISLCDIPKNDLNQKPINAMLDKLCDAILLTNDSRNNGDTLQSLNVSFPSNVGDGCNPIKRLFLRHFITEYTNHKLDIEVDRPFHLVDLGDIIRAYKRWMKHLPNITPYYAMKCNPHPLVLSILYLCGVRHWDCASKGEFELLSQLDIFDRSKICYSHPIKPISHLQYTAPHSSVIEFTVFDCTEELHKIAENHPKIPLLLRVKWDSKHSGVSNNRKFGCYEKEAMDLLSEAQKLNVPMCGLMFHGGAHPKDALLYREGIELCSRLFNHANTKLGMKLDILDIGGGYPGIDNHHQMKCCTFDECVVTLTKAIDEYLKPLSQPITVISEPGRFFVTTMSTTVVKIVGKKRRSNNLLSYYWNDGVFQTYSYNLYEPIHPKIISSHILDDTNKDSKMDPIKCEVFGPTCDPSDIVFNEIQLPELDIGDTLFSENWGAYGWKIFTSFNEFPVPKEFFILSV